MHGEAKRLLKFLDGSDNRYIIPVYQRNYDWKQKQCAQLFDDLIQIIKKNRESHFFGSIVTSLATGGGGSDYLVIDGQQRITTISLLFAAMVNLIKEKAVISDDPKLAEKIEKKFLVDEYQKDERKLRLKPIKADCECFDKIVKNDNAGFIESSITQNYLYFYDRIKKSEITIDELYEAVKRLEIIDIFLEHSDNPQLIFESLNSTGLDLTEGDKIRNFILMGLDSSIQKQYYDKYWNKIEKFTNYDVSSFIRNYLTFVQRKIPKINDVYSIFKNYVNKSLNIESTTDCEKILQDLTYYAEIHQNIITAKADAKNEDSSILCRLNQIDMTVAYPFLYAMLGRAKKGEITNSDVTSSLKCIESYVFRRLMCMEYTTNALNKIFCTLDSDTMEFKSKYPDKSYASILIYILESKNGSGTFPTNAKFAVGMKERNVYHMNKKNREYLFDRLENGDTVERVNVIGMMENQDLSIEHIMPQTLNDTWKAELGPNYQKVYDERLHTLANLTLTGYNSKYSNNLFADKKNAEKGFKDSGLNLNKPLLKYEHWTLTEMEDRLEKLIEQAYILWPYPETNFVPPIKPMDTVTLDDDEDLTGRDLVSYSYGNVENRSISVWADMLVEVVTQLYERDPSQIRILAADKKCAYLSFQPKTGHAGDSVQIAKDVYVYKASSTASKLDALTKLFDAYGYDKTDLEFNLKPIEI